MEEENVQDPVKFSPICLPSQRELKNSLMLLCVPFFALSVESPPLPCLTPRSAFHGFQLLVRF